MNNRKNAWSSLAFNISELDFENIGAWPILAKCLTLVIVVVLVVVGGYFFHIKEMLANVEYEMSVEPKLKEEYSQLVNQAVNKQAYESQLKVIEKELDFLVKKLPTKKEIPSLLESISETARNSGLVFDAIDMKDENDNQFYVELPMEIKAIGGYHEIAKFVSGVANLSRIVTVNDIKINKERQTQLLDLDLSLKTYMYKE